IVQFSKSFTVFGPCFYFQEGHHRPDWRPWQAGSGLQAVVWRPLRYSNITSRNLYERHVYVCMYMCVYVCVYVCVYMYACMYVYVCTYMYMYVCIIYGGIVQGKCPPQNGRGIVRGELSGGS